MTNNPYLETNWETELCISDSRIKHQAKLSLLQFFSKTQPKNLFFELAKSRLRIFYFISTHMVFCGIITSFVFCLTILGAEAKAPDNLKPSKLFDYAKSEIIKTFQTNKIIDKNPFESLNPDDQNYVNNSQSCDLSIKYPKTLNGLDLLYGSYDSTYYLGVNRPTGNTADRTEYKPLLTISCQQDPAESSEINLTSMTVKELGIKTGWHITQSDNLNNIKYSSSIRNNITIESIQFQHKLLNYKINRFQENQTNFNFEFTDFQLQFNSVVQNRFSQNTSLNRQKNKVCPDLQINHQFDLYRYDEYNIADDDIYKVSIANFSSEEIYNALDYKPEYVTFELECFAKPLLSSDLKKQGFEQIKAAEIPFLNDNMVKSIVPSSMWQKKYSVLNSGSSWEPEIEGNYVKYIFEGLNGISYQIEVTHPEVVYTQFRIKLLWSEKNNTKQ